MYGARKCRGRRRHRRPASWLARHRASAYVRAALASKAKAKISMAICAPCHRAASTRPCNRRIVWRYSSAAAPINMSHACACIVSASSSLRLERGRNLISEKAVVFMAWRMALSFGSAHERRVHDMLGGPMAAQGIFYWSSAREAGGGALVEARSRRQQQWRLLKNGGDNVIFWAKRPGAFEKLIRQHSRALESGERGDDGGKNAARNHCRRLYSKIWRAYK